MISFHPSYIKFCWGGKKTNKAIPCLKPCHLHFYLMELIVILATCCLKNPNETEQEVNVTACHSTEQANHN